MAFLRTFWDVLALMSPWLLVGFLLAGVLSVLMPHELAVKAMGRANRADQFEVAYVFR